MTPYHKTFNMPKKEKITMLFDSIAPEYDRLNHLLSLDIDKTWRRRAVRRIVDRQCPLNILDVACGTGDFTIAIARKAAPGSRITGLDLSEGMLLCLTSEKPAASIMALNFSGPGNLSTDAGRYSYAALSPEIFPPIMGSILRKYCL